MNDRASIEKDIYAHGSVNRHHLLAFLRLLPTSDVQAIQTAVNQWLIKLHDNPYYSKVTFDSDAISRVVQDLESYGRVTQETVIGAPPNPNL